MAQRPPRKGSGGRRQADDPIHHEQKRIQEEQKALLRKQEEARRILEEAPRRMEQLKKRQREPIKITLKATRAGQKSFGVPHDKFREAGLEPRKRRKSRTERNIALIKFIALCLILAGILFAICQQIPASR